MNSTFNTSLNTKFNDSVDEDFNTALKMCDADFDYQSLMGFIEKGEIVQKQIAVLKLSEIKSKEDAKLLVSNLINQNGKVREVVALKVNEFIKNPTMSEFFYCEENFQVFSQALIDVNANVCRQILEVICFLRENEAFSQFIIKELPEKIQETFEKLEGFKFDDKQHVINKTIFKLYWYLEALYEFVDVIEFDVLKEILLKAGAFYDYTIREKVAKILVVGNYFNDKELSELIFNLKNDENYYVRRLLQED